LRACLQYNTPIPTKLKMIEPIIQGIGEENSRFVRGMVLGWISFPSDPSFSTFLMLS
jgi:hypothetical protein